MKPFFVFLFILCTHFSEAQLLNKFSARPDPVADSLLFIIKDFAFNYRNIQGDLISTNDQTEIFESTVSIPGANTATILRFQSVEDSTASWQALMYKGDDYKLAQKVYKNLFRQLRGMRFGDGINNIQFIGTLVNPTEDLRFTSSILYADASSGIYKNFVANIDLNNNFAGWEVRLSLNRKKDDREKY